MSSVKHILKQQAEEEEREAEAEGERRPLVYVDDVGSYSDFDGSRRRRRKSVALVLTVVVCIAVGLSLAVALPFVTLSGGPTRDEEEEAPVALQSSLEQGIDQPVQLIAINIIPKTEELEKTTEEDLLGSSSAPSDFSSSSSSSQEVTSDAPTPTHTPTHTPTPSPFPTPDPFFAACPEVPEHRRGFVDLEFLRGKLLFEVFRIQTEQSPASVAGGGGISCSVAELDFTSDGSNETSSADGQHHPSHGTMKLRYMEGRSFFSRTLRRVQVNLTEATSSSRDFVESFGHGFQGRLSFLVQADVFVLTYECFPSYPGDLRPGYAIHVYSLLPPPPSGGGGGEGDKAELSKALLRLAGVWGLNPGRRPVVEVGQRFCNR